MSEGECSEILSSNQLQSVTWADLDDAARAVAVARAPQTMEADRVEMVRRIIDQVAADGDNTLLALTRRFDGCALDDLRLDLEQYDDINPNSTLGRAVEQAIATLTAFHRAGIPRGYGLDTVPGVHCEVQIRPIRAVGLYVPAGTAPLISTVMMLAIPALLAGCARIVVCTPPGLDGRINADLAAVLKRLGVTEVYRVGGAQAIAALAVGTETIAPVDKIFGPGNTFVTLAKQLVAQRTGGPAIDMPAGPSEVMVVADEKARPAFVAADLLSQAEHGPDSQAMLVVTKASVADKVRAEVARQLAKLPRRDVAAAALENSRIIVANGRIEALAIANRYAAEHLILQIEHPERALEQIEAAGSVFVGPFAPEALGDYCSGTNHVLPTSGAARAYSGIGVESFVNRIMVQTVTQEGLNRLADTAEALAAAENLEAHRRAVAIRRGEA